MAKILLRFPKINFGALFIGALLYVAFSCSAISYYDGSLAWRVAAPAIMAFAGLLALFVSRGRCLSRISLWGIAFAIFLTLQSLISMSQQSSSILGGLTLLISIAATVGAMFIGATYGSVLPFISFSCFAGTVIALLPVVYGGLVDKMTSGERLASDDLHPNTIGYVGIGIASAGICLLFYRQIWLKLIGLVLVAGAALLMILAESRGNILGIMASAACVYLVWLYSVKDRGDMLVKSLLIGLGLLVIAAGTFVVNPWNVTDILLDKLAVFNSYRGIDSGLTGRVDAWSYTLTNMTAWDWLVGVGYRMSGVFFGGAIDNSYIVLFADLGFLAPVLIVGWLASAGLLSVKRAVQVHNTRDYPAVLFSIAILSGVAVASIFCRYLFAIGNPTSLLTLLVLANAGRAKWEKPSKSTRSNLSQIKRKEILT